MNKVKLLPHNQETFEKIMKLYKLNNRVCAIQATGTGKSYLIGRLLEEYKDLHAIIFSPNDDIIEQTEGLLEECDLHNAECVTYQKLLYMTDEDISNIKADLIIIDEFHRVGAYKWGRKIQHLLDSHESSKLFGVTATPIRPFDGKDMSEEIFYGNKACDISLAEAIVREIVKMPIYVSGLFSFEEEFVNMKNKIEKSKNSVLEKNDLMKELSAAKKQLEKSCGVPEIIRKHITNYNSKYIVFCQNTIHLKEMIDVVKGWFIDAGYHGDIYNYSVGSKIRGSKKSLNEFKTNNKQGLKLLFCIDKLNEGLHMPKVSGVILLRPTKSNIIYYQQIGRTIDAKRIEPGIILDLVTNFNGLSQNVSLKKDLEEAIKRRKDGGYRGCSVEFDLTKFYIFDELQNTINVFKGIDSQLYSTTLNHLLELWDLYATSGFNEESIDNLNEFKKLKNRWRNKIQRKKVSNKTIEILEKHKFPMTYDEEYIMVIDHLLNTYTHEDLLKNKKIVYTINRFKNKHITGVLFDYLSCNEKFLHLFNEYILKNNTDKVFEHFKNMLNSFISSGNDVNDIKESSLYNGYEIGKYFYKFKYKTKYASFFKSVGATTNNYNQKERFIYKLNLLNECIDNYTNVGKKLIYKGEKIGEWYRVQRKKYRKGSLEDYKIEEFRKRNIPLNVA